MDDTDSPLSGVVTDILSSAVSHHAQEQRDLREELARLREGLGGFREGLSATTADVQALANAMLELNSGLRDRFGSLDEGVRDSLGGIEESVGDRLGGIEKSVGDRLGAIEESFRDRFAFVDDNLHDRFKSLDEAVSALRTGMSDLETRVGSFASTIGQGLQELARTQQDALESLGAAVSSAVDRLGQELGDVIASRLRPVESSTRSLDQRLAAIDTVRERLAQTQSTLSTGMDEIRMRVSETADVVTYLRDQSEDLDRVLGTVGDVPTRVEAVLSQALRRALTVRAGLLEEAERALQDVMGPFTEQVERIVAEVAVAGRATGKSPGKAGDDLRRVVLGQTELSARIDQLQDTLQSFMDAADEERRERDWSVTEALDEEAEEPEEAEGAGEAPPVTRRAARPRRTTPKRRPAARKPAARKPPAANPAARKPAAAKTKTTRPAPRKSSSKAAGSKTTGTRSRTQSKDAGAAKRATRARKRPAAERKPPQPSRRKRTYIPL